MSESSHVSVHEVEDGLTRRPSDIDLDARGDPLPARTAPASEFISEVENSWKKMIEYESWISWFGKGVVAAFAKAHVRGAEGNEGFSVIPIVAALLLFCYLVDIGCALFIKTFWTFIAWEEAFVIAALVFAWLISASRIRTFVACEYSRYKMAKRHRYRMMHLIAAYAQSKPAIALQVLCAVLRLWIRIVARSVYPVLIIETACEATAVVIAIAIVCIITAHEVRHYNACVCEEHPNSMTGGEEQNSKNTSGVTS